MRLSLRPVLRLTPLLTLALLASLLPACSPGPGNATLDVTLDSGRITPAAVTVRAGQILFHLKNIAGDGQSHQFMVVRTTLRAAQLPFRPDGSVADDLSTVVILYNGDPIPPGKTASAALSLDPGHYVLLCNLPDHYRAGEYVDFTVTR